MAGKAKNWAGKKFGMLLFISDTGKKDEKGRRLWRALCDCGKETEASPSHVKRGQVGISCGCKLPYNAQDWTGKKFDKITFHSDSGERSKDGKTLWHASCECGTPLKLNPSQAKCGKWGS